MSIGHFQGLPFVGNTVTLDSEMDRETRPSSESKFSTAEPLFTKGVSRPEDQNDSGQLQDEEQSVLSMAGYCLFFLFAAFAFNFWWSSISLPSDSFAGGRNASIRRLIGRIGQLPLTVICVLIALVFAGSALSQLRSRVSDNANS
jgi:hypothetical protein